MRFAASKLVEGDAHVREALALDKNELDAVEHIVHQMEEERGLDRAAAIADMRFSFIERIVSAAVVKPHASRELERSRKIDRVLTGKYTAIPMFVLIMGAVFFLTFNVVGLALQNLVAAGVDALTAAADAGLTAAGVNPVLHSLVIGGIFNAIGTVLPIAPIIVTMFFFLSLLEDTGYMARVAFFMDKLLRKIGLSGRSIVPMLVGFGCTVPAVMSARTLPSERDRKLTIALTPFMSCTTKLTIYGYFSAAFFPGKGGLVMLCLYLTGIVVGVLVALITHKTIDKAEAVPFVMELPNYRLPSAKSVVHRGVRGSRRRVVPAVLHAGTYGRQGRTRVYPGSHCHLDRPGLLAPGLWRLAHHHGAHRGLHGEGDRGRDAVRPVWLHGAASGRAHAAFRRVASGVLPSVHAVRRGHRGHQARAGRPLGAGHSRVPVRYRLPRGAFGARGRRPVGLRVGVDCRSPGVKARSGVP